MPDAVRDVITTFAEEPHARIGQPVARPVPARPYPLLHPHPAARGHFPSDDRSLQRQGRAEV